MSQESRTRLILSSCFIPASVGSDGAPFKSCALTAGLSSDSPQVLFCLEGGQSGIGSQIATKMAGDTAMEEIYRCLVDEDVKEEGLSELLVRNAFKAANSEVYRYAHTMAAGGQIAAKAILSIFDGRKLTVGQVGPYESLLFRDGQLMRFFDHPAELFSNNTAVLDRFVGANSKVLVDLAALEVQQDDLVLLTTASCSEKFFEDVGNYLRHKQGDLASIATEVGKIMLSIEESSDSRASDYQNQTIFVARLSEAS